MTIIRRDVLLKLALTALAGVTLSIAIMRPAGAAETLSEMLQGEGPYTVLAPTNAAFDALPPGMLETLREPENADDLSLLMACLHIPGIVLSTEISEMTESNGGEYVVESLGGCKLTFKMRNRVVTVTDENGTVARVTIPDNKQSNGIIHVIDKVLFPAGMGR